MSLTEALALLGAVVLAGLALHGWWRMRRATPRRMLAVDSSAGGEPGERVEPPLGLDGDIEPTAPGALDTQPFPEADLPPARRAALRRGPRLDALIDAIVPLVPESPLTGEAVLAHLPPTRRVGSKPFLIEGLDTESGHWEPPAVGRRYGELQAGVQMANRHGALNEIEYSEFVQKVEALGEALNARADVPDMLDVVARARELDAMTSPLDAQLTIGLRASGVAWSVGYVQQIAARHGFVPGAVPGRWVLPGAEEGAPPLLVLSVDAQAALAEDPGAAAVRDCTLSLDVPQTAESEEPYPAFHRAATALADDLDATTIDDHGEALTLAAFKAIGEEVRRLYRGLEALDLAAGTPAARRLFS